MKTGLSQPAYKSLQYRLSMFIRVVINGKKILSFCIHCLNNACTFNNFSSDLDHFTVTQFQFVFVQC